MTAGDGQRVWGLGSSSMEMMLEFVMVDWVGGRRRAVSDSRGLAYLPWLCPLPGLMLVLAI